MTDRKLMQQALEALDRVISHAQEAEDILLAALSDGTEQPQRTHWEGCEQVHPECKKPEQEPVAWLVQYSNKHEFVWGQKPQWIADAIGIEPLYTTPQPRTWVGLTDDQVSAIADQHPVEGFDPSIMAFARAIEAKLREKNNV